MSKVVAFDIDDTILDLVTPTLKIGNRLFNQSKTVKDMVELNSRPSFDPYGDYYAQLYGVTVADIDRLYSENEVEIYSSPDLFPKAKDAIQKHLDLGHKVVFITARWESTSELTQRYLERHGLGNIPVYYQGSKVPLAKELGVSLFYEDNLKNAKQLSEAGIVVRLVNAPRNWSIDVNYLRYEWNHNFSIRRL